MRKSVFPRLILGLRPTLICSIGALTILSVGLVAVISYVSSRAMVGSLASGIVNLGLARLEQAVRREFDALVEQAAYVGRAVTIGQYNVSDPEPLADFLKGSLASAPQIDGVVVADADFKAIVARRGERGGDASVRSFTVGSDSGLGRLAIRAAAAKKAFWMEPRYQARRQSTVIGLFVPIHEGDTYRGFVAAGIFSKTLSEFTRDLSQPGRFEAFILFGRDKVLAHPNLVHGSPKMTVENPLLGLGEVKDAVLANFSDARPRDDADFNLSKGSEALFVTADGVEHEVFLKRIDGYGHVPLYVGAHYANTLLDRVLRTLRHQGMIGAGLLVTALILAVILSRMIASPIRRASEGVSRIQALDFEEVKPLARSRLQEIDKLALSFNAMLGGLRSFGRYVPRRLVQRLIRENRVGAGSEERELTVMFTDIAGFSKACEAMSAREVAEFINSHLTLVSDCIEAEGGTIDKYIGDAVMAFWGSPDTLENTAQPACRAAIAIRDALHKDNERRAAEGLEKVRVRIGIHTGALVVGDIGTPTRINYTVVGDVVNGAQRLEALGKEIAAEAETTILISRETEDLLGPEIERHAEGSRQVKGKQQRLDVFRLV